MKGAVLLSLVLLGGGKPAARRLTVDGVPVPPASVRVVGGRILVACRWLEERAAGFTCFDARPNGVRSVSVQAVQRPGDGLRGVTFTPSTTQVRTYRHFTWTATGNLPGLAVFGENVFLPVRELAAGLNAPLDARGGAVALGHAPGFARLMTALSTGTLAQAREASAWLKTREEVNVLRPGGQASETNDTVTLWPQGEVFRQFTWADDVVSYAELQGGWWVIRWAGKLADGFTHERREDPPAAGRTGEDTLARYLGAPFARQVGVRPPVGGPLSFQAGHIFGPSTTRFWGTVTPEGREIPRLNAYWQDGERLVPAGRGALEPATDPLPDPYGWEERSPGR